MYIYIDLSLRWIPGGEIDGSRTNVFVILVIIATLPSLDVVNIVHQLMRLSPYTFASIGVKL